MFFFHSNRVKNKVLLYPYHQITTHKIAEKRQQIPTMDRLRNRDLRTNNNKCYTMYFDDDQNKDITNKTMSTKKPKTRSPRKKEPTKNYQADSTSTESMPLNQIGPHTPSDETKTNDAVAVNELNAIASTHGNRKTASKPLDFSGTIEGDNVNVASNGGVESSTDSERMNNGTMVDISTTLLSDSMDNNKPTDLERSKANDSTNDANAMEMERNDRKRRLSQSHDRTVEVDDDDDEDAESCETDGLSYTGKKAKMECSRSKMFQVGRFFKNLFRTRSFAAI